MRPEVKEEVRRNGWRFLPAYYLRLFGWWVLRLSCRVRGQHTYLDRLQQQCWACDHNLFVNGQTVSTALMKRIGLARDPEREVVERTGGRRAVRW